MAENEDSNSTAPTPAPTTGDNSAAGSDPAQGPQFALQRIFLKDCSFESPRSPLVFQSQWNPKINFDIKTRSSKVQDGVYEVVLVLTAEAQIDENPAFLVEVHQAGIFTAKDFDDTQLEQLLATVCPNILFPYARENIDSVCVKGGFPPVMLAPVNFEALYQQALTQAQSQAAEGGTDAAATH
jgi:preprotein translocase subunit SecB